MHTQSPSHSSSGVASSGTSSRRSPLPRSPTSPLPPSPSTYRHNPDTPQPHSKDLSFLLHPSFYLPVSQAEIPPQFRVPLEPISLSTPVPDLLAEVESLLSRGDVLTAGHVAAGILTSPGLDPTDTKTIAYLLSVRYSCLELTGNTLIAAQESKALEDLNSEFYYVSPTPTSFQQSKLETTSTLPNHILPYSLRLQALRLQSIGFSDPRRAVAALYDLGLECREHIASPLISLSERKLWEGRLAELGIRVVNALIDVNDLECAKRSLLSLRASNDLDWLVRMGLLLMKLGDIPAARNHLRASPEISEFLGPLLATAEGRFEDAIHEWEILASKNGEKHRETIIQQNLAVNYMYAGRLKEAHHMMEGMIESGEGYRSLTFNLATVYELSSERSRDLKTNLAARIASQEEMVRKVGPGKIWISSSE